MSARLRRGWCRIAAAALAFSVTASCAGSDPSPAPTVSMSPQTATVARDYWPTSGWRTASPKDHGIDPAALADFDGVVPNRYPSVRSVLIVRHGYLVYEHYWHGFDQTSGHDVRSVTKSFIGA